MNRQKLAIDPVRLEPKPRAEYDGSVGKLASLWERIGENDGLIDYFSAMRTY